MGENLEPLGHARGKFAACLDLVEVDICGCALGQGRNENICGGDRVLDGEIDADAADGGHGVGGVADAEESAARPVAQAVDGDGQEFDVAPVFQLGGAALQKWCDSFEVLAKRGQALFLDGVESAFSYDVRALSVITAVKRYQELSGAEAAESLRGIGGEARKAHPKHVDGSDEIDYFETGFSAY